ncbi:MAG TPA: (d)CMP kinase [Sedimentisphaerales bacterium]|jgi:cytidylate kinase|nr:(d)CMP kinase [Sedimentisphaerales bacterium]HNU30698.1 (d)CMP kinase [Sedimentisphaerales bacterium]
MADLIITIDGPAGSGKSTMAKRLAQRLGATFLDTGAMYRAITLAAVRDGADLTDEGQLVRVVQSHRFDFEASGGRMLVRVDGDDVTESIRDPELTAKVRHVAGAPRVREQLVAMQRAFAARHDKIVTEGRDQGTVVFPDARIKFFLTADAAERARRRAQELQAKGADVNLDEIQQAIEARDKSDESRAVGPLKAAPDAVRIDSTGSSIEESVERICRRVEDLLRPASPASAKPQEQNPERTVGKDRHHESLQVPRSPAFWYWIARSVCWVFCKVFFRYRAYGRENLPRTGAFILAGNHQSFLDPVFCGIAVKRHVTYMARDTLFKHWFFGRLIASVNAIPLSRDKADIAVMRLVIDRLRQGAAVCLYPEGTRTSDGRISPFKPGFGLLCRRSKATVVPVLIDGAFECWPRHKKLFSPGSIVVQFGKPLPPEQVATMDNEQLADAVTQILREMQREVRLKQGKQPYEYEGT